MVQRDQSGEHRGIGGSSFEPFHRTSVLIPAVRNVKFDSGGPLRVRGCTCGRESSRLVFRLARGYGRAAWRGSSYAETLQGTRSRQAPRQIPQYRSRIAPGCPIGWEQATFLRKKRFDLFAVRGERYGPEIRSDNVSVLRLRLRNAARSPGWKADRHHSIQDEPHESGQALHQRLECA